MTLQHGIDVNNNLVPLLLDPSGKVLIYGTLQAQLVAGSADIGGVDVLTLPALPNGTNAIGTVKPLSFNNDPLFSYDVAVLEQDLVASLAAGTNNIYTSAVPVNKLWVLTAVSVVYTGTITNVSMQVAIYDGVNTLFFFYVKPVVSAQVYPLQTTWYLKAGWKLRFYVTAATAGDSASISINGYQMALT